MNSTSEKQLAQQRARYHQLKQNPAWLTDRNRKRREYEAHRRNSNPDKMRSYFRNGNLKKLYGITTEQFNVMAEDQNYTCKVCGTAPGNTNRRDRLHVDHCHTTGKIRGLLCANCNNAMGYAGDDPMRLRALADYLENN